MKTDINHFYLNHQEPLRSCFLAMRSLLLSSDNEVTETIKYGMPCFCYKGKMFCYLWKDKKTYLPYFLFVEGAKLNHPKLTSGNRKRMKTFTVDPNKDLPINVLNTLIRQAIELYH